MNVQIDRFSQHLTQNQGCSNLCQDLICKLLDRRHETTGPTDVRGVPTWCIVSLERFHLTASHGLLVNLRHCAILFQHQICAREGGVGVVGQGTSHHGCCRESSGPLLGSHVVDVVEEILRGVVHRDETFYTVFL